MTHDWDGAWAKKAKALPGVDWERFRRDPVLMGAIQTSDAKRVAFWNKCEAANVPMALREDSLVGDPKGAKMRGVFVTATSLKMAYFLYRILTLWDPPPSPRVLEIGGGFGGMARTVTRWLSGVRRYCLVDGPPCLEMQRRYLRELFPDEADNPFDFIQHGVTPLLFGEKFDLVINIASFSEMTPEIVDKYFDVIHDVLVPGGALYVLNRDSYGHGGKRVNVPASRFPWDDRWEYRRMSSPSKYWVETLAIRKGEKR